MEDVDAARLSRVIVELRRAQRIHNAAPSPAPRLTMMQKEVLGCVAAAPGVGTSAIAQSLHLKPNTVSGVVSTLVRLGYLERSTDVRDRRATRLLLTEKARHASSLRWEGRADRISAGLAHLDDTQRVAIQLALPALESLRDALGPGTP